MTLVLASASPARLTTLRRAGVDPIVWVSTVDEDAVVAAARDRYGELGCAEVALLLARAKCEDVAGRIQAGGALAGSNPVEAGAGTDTPPLTGRRGRVLVLGCDSVLDIDGQAYGKPGDAHTARQRWRTMRGTCGVLHTGHWLIDLGAETNTRSATGTRALGSVAATTVWFADLPDAEIDAYVDTGEPLHVAGAFTIDGLGGPFVDRIEGDPHNVVGVSLPVVRQLLSQLGLAWYDVRRRTRPS